MKRCISFMVILLSGTFHLQAQSVKAATIFNDHMVIQQGINAPVWGTANMHDTVQIEFAGLRCFAVADTNGRWIARMPVLSAGGPYTMKVSTKNDTLTFSDVMVGEVWLASGQSNMNRKLKGIYSNRDSEIAGATYPFIRMFTVNETFSRTPVANLQAGSWERTTPEAVANFSAVAYFFALKLYKERKVPVGIIHSSYSGTPIEAWMSADMLSILPEFRQKIQLNNKDKDWEERNKAAAEKDRERIQIAATAHAGVSTGVHLPDYKDSDWKMADYPIKVVALDSGKVPYYSFIWFRKHVQINKAVNKNYTLSLGKVIYSDITYFNGVEVGRGNGEGYRTYTIPGHLVRKGKNVVAIRLLSEWGYGRIGDPIDNPELSTGSSAKISLSGTWLYNYTIEPRLPSGTLSKNEPSVLFNAMINPVLPYGIKGILWYQGEGNANNPALYKSTFAMLLNDWRIRCQQGNIPFLFVQLPNLAGSLAWVKFREAQKSLLKYDNTGMVVSIDVGDPYDVHPANKKAIGERLYQVSRQVAYNEVPKVTHYDSIRIEANSLSIVFPKEAGRFTVKNNEPLKAFQIAGKDKIFYPAEAVIRDNVIIVSSEKVTQPVAVRYAWSANPEINLYDNYGMPISPFRTDEWEE